MVFVRCGRKNETGHCSSETRVVERVSVEKTIHHDSNSNNDLTVCLGSSLIKKSSFDDLPFCYLISNWGSNESFPYFTNKQFIGGTIPKYAVIKCRYWFASSETHRPHPIVTKLELASQGKRTTKMKRPWLMAAWPLLWILYSSAILTAVVDSNKSKNNDARLKVSIRKDTMLGVPSCQHTFSQIELLNMVRQSLKWKR